MLQAQAAGGDDDDDDGDEEEDGDDTAAPSPPPKLFTASDNSRHSLVQLHGSLSSTCGYCHAATRGRDSFGMTAKALLCADYQALIDMGWRRSGDYCYRPHNESGCCPNWTIRLHVGEFVKSRQQRKVERRMKDWLERRVEESSKGAGVGSMDDVKGAEESDEKMAEEAQKEAEDPNVATLVSVHSLVSMARHQRAARDHSRLPVMPCVFHSAGLSYLA